MENLYNQKTIDAVNVFDDYYVDAKMLYLYWFNALPDQAYIRQVDGEKAMGMVQEKFGDQVVGVHRYRCHNSKKKQYEFNVTLVVLKNHCVIELNKGYCEIWHDGK